MQIYIKISVARKDDVYHNRKAQELSRNNLISKTLKIFNNKNVLNKENNLKIYH